MSTLKANRIENLTTTDGGIDINNSGNVGIGVSAPTTPLQVHSSTTASTIRITNSTSGATSSDGLIIQESGNDAYIWNKENSFISFGTNNTERMKITSSGNLLLNGGSDVRIELGTNGSTGTNDRNFVRGDGDFLKYNCNAGGGHIFEANGGERCRIHTNGNVGIGTSSPGRLFEVSDSQAGELVAARFTNSRDVGTDVVSIAFGLARSGGLIHEAGKIKLIKSQAFTGTPSTVDADMTFETIRDESRFESVRLKSSGEVALTLAGGDLFRIGGGSNHSIFRNGRCGIHLTTDALLPTNGSGTVNDNGDGTLGHPASVLMIFTPPTEQFRLQIKH